MRKENLKKFFSEIQVLKRIKHEGWRLAGIENPDSIAEHAFCAAQIAYVLGKMEGADAAKCAVMSLFHDNEETRVGDHHKVAARYLEWKKGSDEARREHFENLPPEIAKEILALQAEKGRRDTKEGVVAKDADWFEVAIQAKIYI
ncbi:MAG: HD domain-containing protein, partial [Patescibacteria group bacterium]